MFPIKCNSNDYQPVAESPCQMLVSALSVLLPVSILATLEAMRWALSYYLWFYSIWSLRATYPRILGIRKTQLYRQRPAVSLKGLEDLNCSDDKSFSVAHPILESSGLVQISWSALWLLPQHCLAQIPGLISRSGTRWPLQTLLASFTRR